MKPLTAIQIAEATNGKVLLGSKEAQISNIAIDSRKVTEDSLFVAIIGENHDAHDFLVQVFEQGCRVALVSDEDKALVMLDEFLSNNSINNHFELSLRPTVILVNDTVQALADLAKYYLSQMSIKKIAVTGSTGKTSTKDMLYYICNEKYRTARTIGNFNNEIGLPLTALALDEDIEVAIFEMGMSDFGEISHLANIVRPDIAIITNVGTSHIENLGSRRGILTAKLEITDFFKESNVLVINDSGDVLTRESATGDYRLKTVGFDGHSDYIISSVEDSGAEALSFALEKDCMLWHISLPVGGRHNAINASLAIAACEEIGISPEQAMTGLAKMELTDKRLSVKGKKGIKVIDDTYNASPDSMKAALDVLEATKGMKKIAILGDMYELGEDSPLYHYEVGKYAGEKAIDMLIAIGENANEIFKGYSDTISQKQKTSDEVNQHETDDISQVAETNASERMMLEKPKALYFENKEKFLENLSELVVPGDTVLVKASRGMAMEKIVNKILE